jgi:hypothetical protein
MDIKSDGYNRNLMGGKRPHKGITKYPASLTLAERLIAETKALDDYCKRLKQGRYKLK